MIRINLLPFRAAKRKENIRRQVTVYGLILVLMAAAMVLVFINLTSEFNQLKSREKKIQDELAALEKTVQQIAKMETQIAEIKKKLGVIQELEKNKTGPVHLFDEIASAVPKDRLWLRSIGETGGVLKLTGTAMDNETVALFMINLEKSGYVTGVDLKSTKLVNLAQYRLNVSEFELECKTFAFKEKPKPQAAKK